MNVFLYIGVTASSSLIIFFPIKWVHKLSPEMLLRILFVKLILVKREAIIGNITQKYSIGSINFPYCLLIV